MPIKRSAAKRMRSDYKKNQTNHTALAELHTLQRKLTAWATQKPEDAKALGRLLVSKLDKAVSRGIIPHGRADRKKARIAKLLSKVQS